MKCSHCQQQHPNFQNYCPTTGKVIDYAISQKYIYETVDFCVSCGASNESNSLCCSKCGTDNIKLVGKKNTVDQFIDKSLTAIPDIPANIPLNLKNVSIKETITENLKYMKNTPLIFLPIVISIALLFLVTNTFINKIKDGFGAVANALELGYIGLFDIGLVEAILAEEYGIDLSLPEIPIFTSLLSMMHNLNFDVLLELSESGYREFFMLEEKNILLGLLIIPIVALVIGAIVYGIMARKFKWDFWRGVTYSSIIYTLFLAIVAIIAKYEFSAKAKDEYGDTIKVGASLGVSIFDAILTGAILSAVIFSFIGYISYTGKLFVKMIQDEWKYFKYAMYAFIATFIGIVIHLVNAFIAVKNNVEVLTENLYDEYFFGFVPEWIYYVNSMYIAIYNWYMSFFGKINILLVKYGEKESNEYAWFFNSKLNELDVKEITEVTTFLPPFIMVIISFLLLAGIGYCLTTYKLLGWKDIAIVSGVFTGLQLIILFFVNASIVIEGSQVNSVTIEFYISMLLQAIIFLVFAFIAILGGSYVKSYRK